MKKFGEALGFLIALNGVAGLIHEWLGWFRLWAVVGHLDFLDGYEIVANIALIVLGVIVMIAADQLVKDAGSGAGTDPIP